MPNYKAQHTFKSDGFTDALLDSREALHQLFIDMHKIATCQIPHDEVLQFAFDSTQAAILIASPMLPKLTPGN